MRPTEWRRVPAPFSGMKCWQRNLPDGHLTAMLSMDDGLLHLSLSHRRDSKRGPVPGRLPTWTELRDARYTFCPDGVTMVMVLPPKGEYVNVHETTFHLWESKEDWS